MSISGTPDEDELTLTEAAWPFNADSPHVADILAAGGKVRTLLVDVTGLEPDEIAGHLDTVLDSARQSGLVPVFLTDTQDLMFFYRKELVFDAVPRAAAQAWMLPDLDWTGYIERRRRLASEKWRPAATVRLGPVEGSGR